MGWNMRRIVRGWGAGCEDLNSIIQDGMWAFGHRIREVERSRYRLVVEEIPSGPVVWMLSDVCLFFSLLTLRIGPWGLVVVLWFAWIGIFASIGSTLTVDRERADLRIERRIVFWRIRKTYDTRKIERVYVVDTQKGSGLAVRFQGGGRKTLTTSLCEDFAWLQAVAVALNVYAHGRRI
jgi:hypothetical protein